MVMSFRQRNDEESHSGDSSLRTSVQNDKQNEISFGHVKMKDEQSYCKN